MTIPDDLLYTKEHEWARINDEDEVATVGITDYAQTQLGELVYLELPEVGAEIEKDEPFGSVESVKSVSELFAPVSGRIAAVNEALADNPQLINEAPYGEGWMVKVEIADYEEVEMLMSPEDYEELTSNAG